jgi:hypothetical protein
VVLITYTNDQRRIIMAYTTRKATTRVTKTKSGGTKITTVKGGIVKKPTKKK